MAKTAYQNLFKPIQIKGPGFKNRITMAPLVMKGKSACCPKWPKPLREDYKGRFR